MDSYHSVKCSLRYGFVLDIDPCCVICTLISNSSATFAQLKQCPVIQKFIAALLALVFLISIVPKTYFHDLIAHHKDISNCKQVHHKPILHQQGFNCHFDDLVVTLPFVLSAPFSYHQIEIFPEKQKQYFTIHFYSQHHFFSELRGPPVC